ncbi:MAG: hypothetical protein HY680_10315 [Chloroflexi bacterium]|nr:hypothetical protein [Chloroflexota bacterium]
MLLLETAIALLVLGVLSGAVLMGLSTVQRSGAKTESQAVMESLARNQMEYVFSLPYQDPPATYPSLSSVPPGYGVTALAEEYVAGDANIQELVVRVTFGDQELLALQTLRAR